MAFEAISYGCFDALIASLRDDGLTTEADRLHVLLHEVAWTTGSELIDELGQELNKIEQAEAPKHSSNSKVRIDECFKMVSKVWPDFTRQNK